MKLVVQRVKQAVLTINDELTAKINQGLLVLVGIAPEDNDKTIEWITKKIVNLRVFNDENGKLNKSVLDIPNGGLLIVSNFTIYGDCRKGFRPSYSDAALPEPAKQTFDNLVKYIKDKWSDKLLIQNGIFGADMQINLTNDGPVTLIVEKN